VVRLEADFGILLRLPMADADFRAATAKRHADLVDAIARHEPDRARASVHAHVDAALARLVEIHAAMQ
jgi:DNA-binding FadR family transcriptional regulator